MKAFVLLKLIPLFWQGHAQDEDFLIQMGKKNVIGLAPEAPTTTTTTSTTEVWTSMITGTMSMTVSDPSAFIANSASAGAVADGLAHHINCPPDWIKVQLSVDTKRLAISTALQQLQQGSVQVSYTINLPEDVVSIFTTASSSDLITAATIISNLQAAAAQGALIAEISSAVIQQVFAVVIAQPTSTPVTQVAKEVKGSVNFDVKDKSECDALKSSNGVAALEGMLALLAMLATHIFGIPAPAIGVAVDCGSSKRQLRDGRGLTANAVNVGLDYDIIMHAGSTMSANDVQTILAHKLVRDGDLTTIVTNALQDIGETVTISNMVAAAPTVSLAQANAQENHYRLGAVGERCSCLSSEECQHIATGEGKTYSVLGHSKNNRPCGCFYDGEHPSHVLYNDDLTGGNYAGAYQQYCKAAMFERSDAGWYCSENEKNSLQAFFVNSDSTADAEIARNQCEDFCLTSAICWGCSVHYTGTHQWNAITSCGTRYEWTGKIVGDITMKKAAPTATTTTTIATTSTTEAPPAGAYGDPHCVNAKGDWFDIHAVGRIPMVILPLGTSIEDSDFAVIATTTTPDGWDKCAPTFISAVDVWANQAHDQLRVDAGPAGDLQVKPMNGSTEPYSIKMLSEKVMITCRSVIVSVMLNKVPKIDQTLFIYFDMEVAGLQGQKAGGVLGADPHDFAQVQPDGCSEGRFKHRAINRYSMAKAMP